MPTYQQAVPRATQSADKLIMTFPFYDVTNGDILIVYAPCMAIAKSYTITWMNVRPGSVNTAAMVMRFRYGNNESPLLFSAFLMTDGYLSANFNNNNQIYNTAKLFGNVNVYNGAPTASGLKIELNTIAGIGTVADFICNVTLNT